LIFHKSRRLANGLAFSCRERAARDHIKNQRSRARSGQLQCRVGRLLGVIWALGLFSDHFYVI
jgi:hypothetical protein